MKTVLKTVLKIGIDALPDGELARFAALFPVAETRSRVGWVRVRPADAEVVVSCGRPWLGSPAVNLCIDPGTARDGDPRLVSLPRGFRVLMLIDALDRAAAQVLQQRSERSAGTATAYRLRHWVVLGPDKLGAHHARVMAAMSRRAVTREWMASGGGLSRAEIDGLLRELREHGALQEAAAEPALRAAAPAALAQSRPGFVGRLRRWFAGERAEPARAGPR